MECFFPIAIIALLCLLVVSLGARCHFWRVPTDTKPEIEYDIETYMGRPNDTLPSKFEEEEWSSFICGSCKEKYEPGHDCEVND